MASALYDKAREDFLAGNLQWKAAGHTFRVMLIDSANYTFSAAHEDMADVPTNSRVGNSGSSARGDGGSIANLVNTGGVADGDDVTLTSVTTGGPYEAVLIYRDDGSADATSRLVAYIDSGTGLPVTTNGGNITITWDSGANKIFKL